MLVKRTRQTHNLSHGWLALFGEPWDLATEDELAALLLEALLCEPAGTRLENIKALQGMLRFECLQFHFSPRTINKPVCRMALGLRSARLERKVLACFRSWRPTADTSCPCEHQSDAWTGWHVIKKKKNRKSILNKGLNGCVCVCVFSLLTFITK